MERKATPIKDELLSGYSLCIGFMQVEDVLDQLDACPAIIDIGSAE
jgi:hypothetical protein